MIPVRSYTDAASLLSDYAALDAKFRPVIRSVVRIPMAVTKSDEQEPPQQKTSMAEWRAHQIEIRREKARAKITTERAYARALINIIAEKHGERASDILGSSMFGSMMRARREAVVAIAKETGLSLSEIARLMAKDHTSIIYAIRAHNEDSGEDVRGLGHLPAHKARKRVGK